MIEIGVDVGGTFTDVVCRAAGRPTMAMKVPTTRKDPSRAIIAAIRQMAEKWDVPAARITRFVHGTTVATNAVLERRGPKIGVLTTRGFKDVLEIGRQMRQQMYDVVLQPETPVFLAPGGMRKEANERLSADGEVVDLTGKGRYLDSWRGDGDVWRIARRTYVSDVSAVAAVVPTAYPVAMTPVAGAPRVVSTRDRDDPSYGLSSWLPGARSADR